MPGALLPRRSRDTIVKLTNAGTQPKYTATGKGKCVDNDAGTATAEKPPQPNHSDTVLTLTDRGKGGKGGHDDKHGKSSKGDNGDNRGSGSKGTAKPAPAEADTVVASHSSQATDTPSPGGFVMIRPAHVHIFLPVSIVEVATPSRAETCTGTPQH